MVTKRFVGRTARYVHRTRAASLVRWASLLRWVPLVRWASLLRRAPLVRWASLLRRASLARWASLLRRAPLVRWVSLGALAVCLNASCATIGHPFRPDRVSQIRIGETTKAQLLGYFGLPYRRGIEDGDSTWTYVHYKLRLFGEKLRTRDLYLRFDDEGRVRSFTYNSNMED